MTSTGVCSMTIGTLSRRTGCKVVTIRYYERIGMLPAPPRSEGGYRLYDDDHLKRLQFIRRCRALGFTLAQVRGLLELVDTGAYTCGEVQAITLAHLQEVRAKIADLQQLEQVLEGMASQCDGGTLPDCPIVEVLSSER